MNADEFALEENKIWIIHNRQTVRAKINKLAIFIMSCIVLSTLFVENKFFFFFF